MAVCACALGSSRTHLGTVAAALTWGGGRSCTKLAVDVSHAVGPVCDCFKALRVDGAGAHSLDGSEIYCLRR